MKVLYVDDEEFNRILLHDMLEIIFENFKIEVYEKAHEVLELDLNSYDMILCDINMPLMSGFELFTLLRDKHNYQKPILALTALAIKGDKEKILSHGFNDYISKPIDINELEKIISKFI